jgi:hypothetical protein
LVRDGPWCARGLVRDDAIDPLSGDGKGIPS